MEAKSVKPIKSEGSMYTSKNVGQGFLATVFILTLLKISLYSSSKDIKNVNVAISIFLIISIFFSCVFDKNNIKFAIPLATMIVFRTIQPYLNNTKKPISYVNEFTTIAIFIEIATTYSLFYKVSTFDTSKINIIMLLVLAIVNIPLYVIINYYETDG